MRRLRFAALGLLPATLTLAFFGVQYTSVEAPNASHLDLLGTTFEALPAGVQILYGMLRRSLGATYMALALTNVWVVVHWLRGQKLDARGLLLAQAALWLLLAWSNLQIGHTILMAANLGLLGTVLAAVLVAHSGKAAAKTPAM